MGFEIVIGVIKCGKIRANVADGVYCNCGYNAVVETSKTFTFSSQLHLRHNLEFVFNIYCCVTLFFLHEII